MPCRKCAVCKTLKTQFVFVTNDHDKGGDLVGSKFTKLPSADRIVDVVDFLFTVW